MFSPAQGATGGWLMPDLVSYAFLLLSSHYLILPGARSLVVYDLGVSSPTPKAQGLISGQEQRFHKWFVLTLSEIKTNIQKQETKDEQNIHIYIHTQEQSQTVQQK